MSLYEEIGTEAAKQAPIVVLFLIAMIIVINYFLKTIQRLSEQGEKTLQDFDKRHMDLMALSSRERVNTIDRFETIADNFYNLAREQKKEHTESLEKISDSFNDLRLFLAEKR